MLASSSNLAQLWGESPSAFQRYFIRMNSLPSELDQFFPGTERKSPPRSCCGFTPQLVFLQTRVAWYRDQHLVDCCAPLNWSYVVAVAVFHLTELLRHCQAALSGVSCAPHKQSLTSVSPLAYTITQACAIETAAPTTLLGLLWTLEHDACPNNCTAGIFGSLPWSISGRSSWRPNNLA
jgi:hypothetical protein